MRRSADYLDATALQWTRQQKCGSCHTNYPYLMSRPALKEFASPALGEVRAFFEQRVAHWDDAEAELETEVGCRGGLNSPGPGHQ